MNLQSELYQIASELPIKDIALKKYNDIRSKLLTLMNVEFTQHCGKMESNLIIIKAFRKIDNDWRAVVQKLRYEGHTCWKPEGFKLYMREYIKEVPKLSCLKKYVNNDN